MKTFFRNWCGKYWLVAEYSLAAIMFTLLILNRNIWEIPNKFCCAIAIFIAIHDAEEWQLPGGFHYQYLFTSQ